MSDTKTKPASHKKKHRPHHRNQSPTDTTGVSEDEADGNNATYHHHHHNNNNAADEITLTTNNNAPNVQHNNSPSRRKKETAYTLNDMLANDEITVSEDIKPSEPSTPSTPSSIPSSSKQKSHHQQKQQHTNLPQDKKAQGPLTRFVSNLKNSQVLKFSGNLKSSTGNLKTSAYVPGLKSTADHLQVFENAMLKHLPKMIDEHSSTHQTGWHLTTRWSLLVWMEILFKSIGVITAFVSLSSAGPKILISFLRIVEIIVIAPLLLGFILILLAVHTDKEFFSFTFTIINGVAHVAVLITFLIGKTTGINIIIFAAAETVGEIYRLVFLDTISQKVVPQSYKQTTTSPTYDFDSIEEQRPHDQPPVTVRKQRLLLGFIFMYIGCYLVIMVMETLTLLLSIGV
eukprot:TRINITY_DN3864_c0_g1_i1.p1 TRINITY_DN3864_c0_g1~~TRINITY_DN3864_c0_g1_i1.p1  ORF type:complete len:400 (-),score=111.50 TRINITY_DN3864_c0_g1_i1:39-1238(-)